MIFWSIVGIVALCMNVAGIEFVNNHLPASAAFVGFGLGYAGLAWMYYA